MAKWRLTRSLAHLDDGLEGEDGGQHDVEHHQRQPVPRRQVVPRRVAADGRRAHVRRPGRPLEAHEESVEQDAALDEEVEGGLAHELQAELPIRILVVQVSDGTAHLDLGGFGAHIVIRGLGVCHLEVIAQHGCIPRASGDEVDIVRERRAARRGGGWGRRLHGREFGWSPRKRFITMMAPNVTRRMK